MDEFVHSDCVELFTRVPKLKINTDKEKRVGQAQSSSPPEERKRKRSRKSTSSRGRVRDQRFHLVAEETAVQDVRGGLALSQGQHSLRETLKVRQEVAVSSRDEKVAHQYSRDLAKSRVSGRKNRNVSLPSPMAIIGQSCLLRDCPLSQGRVNRSKAVQEVVAVLAPTSAVCKHSRSSEEDGKVGRHKSVTEELRLRRVDCLLSGHPGVIQNTCESCTMSPKCPAFPIQSFKILTLTLF
ncbi:UNVERIFIED_CONTAM: hypothetical protein PYX00_004574 [Menopon gallinae]|uniref:Uncharacterized protein n=1 Tax=Menopon gallinae TaxID=328185 RepID=A0AAW2I5L9_9NEOP